MEKSEGTSCSLSILLISLPLVTRTRSGPNGANFGFCEPDFLGRHSIHPPMERHLDRLQQRLALAERDVAHRARLSNGQPGRIYALERRGADCVQVKRLLALLEN